VEADEIRGVAGPCSLLSAICFLLHRRHCSPRLHGSRSPRCEEGTSSRCNFLAMVTCHPADLAALGRGPGRGIGLQS
jgi:hypothetical protein